MAFKATTGRDGAEGVQQQWVVGGQAGGWNAVMVTVRSRRCHVVVAQDGQGGAEGSTPDPAPRT